MKVLILTNYYPPEIGAASSRIYNLAQGLKVRGHEVKVVCPLPNYPTGQIFTGYKGKAYMEEMSEGVRVFRYWIKPSVSKNSLMRLLSMCSFSISLFSFGFKRSIIKEADWVIVQSPPLMVSFAAIVLFKKIYRKKIALNVSDLWPASALDLGALEKGRFYNLLLKMERFNYRSASLILGQSKEILTHIDENTAQKPLFLYRNLPPNLCVQSNVAASRKDKVRIIYAGLLGVAQGIYDIIKRIDFYSCGSEFDIYGEGVEVKLIKEFVINNPHRGVVYKGVTSKGEIHKVISEYHVSLVPLRSRIRGAVPSKLFELIHAQVPILFFGDGEGASIVDDYKIGLVTPLLDYEGLMNSIKKVGSMSDEEYYTLKENCKIASGSNFMFDVQMNKLVDILDYEK